MMRLWNTRHAAPGLGPRRRAASLPASLLARSLAVALALVWLLPVSGAQGVPAAFADGLSDRIASAKQHQQQLQKAIDQQKALLAQLQDDETVAQSAIDSTSVQLDQINTDQATVEAQVQTAAAAIAQVQSRQDTLQAELRQLDWTVSLLQQQIDQGAQDLQTQQRALGQRLADAYRTQQTSLLEQVLSSGSFTDVLSQASAYLAYGDQDAQLAQSIAEDQDSLDALRRMTISTRYRTDQLRREADAAEAQLLTQQQKLQAAQARLADLQKTTSQIQDQQTAAFTRINNTQGKINAALAKQLRQQAAVERHLKKMVKEAQRRAARRDRGPLPTSGHGIFIWPTTGVITQEFGCTGFIMEPPYGSCPHFHQGIDIANAEGTPVHAARGGVIAFVGYNPYDGPDAAYMVVIGHSHGFETMYVHLEPRQLVHRGQYVSQGQLIGYMGNTGHSTGPHLHWQVNLHGRPVNPRDYV
jgi:murein DD-endopeptidase MepM/ murein hydrolase activator NlpD